jgi:DNA-binding protein YbaB
MRAYGHPGGGVSGSAAAEVERRLDDEVERTIRRGEVFTEAKREIEAVAVTQRSPDGAVSVTVRSTGALVGVTCSDQIRTMPPRQVAETFQACVQAAQAGVARRVEEILRAAAPADPLTDELAAEAHKAFPGPQLPAPTASGPRHLTIGDIEDGGPRPRRRHPVRPRPVPEDPDDWGGRTFMS